VVDDDGIGLGVRYGTGSGSDRILKPNLERSVRQRLAVESSDPVCNHILKQNVREKGPGVSTGAFGVG
jgi:hypothetical protein